MAAAAALPAGASPPVDGNAGEVFGCRGGRGAGASPPPLEERGYPHACCARKPRTHISRSSPPLHLPRPGYLPDAGPARLIRIPLPGLDGDAESAGALTGAGYSVAAPLCGDTPGAATGDRQRDARCNGGGANDRTSQERKSKYSQHIHMSMYILTYLFNFRWDR